MAITEHLRVGHEVKTCRNLAVLVVNYKIVSVRMRVEAVQLHRAGSFMRS
jgi:hypothetical protein